MGAGDKDTCSSSSRIARACGRNKSATVRQRLDTGARIASFLAEHPNLRAHRWRIIAEKCLHLAYNDTVRKQLARAYAEWQKRTNEGQYTVYASGGLSPKRMRVSHESHTSRRKMPCIGFELLQWYVDEVESLNCRSDSALLLKQARIIRQWVIDQGVQEKEVPQINKQWLMRWRKVHGIVMRVTTCRMKVSFAVALERIRVMFGNIFRLRRLWERCFGGQTPMRWASFDQKPSWFNNAGLKKLNCRRGASKVGAKEDHHGTRQRYTIMTSVQSWPLASGEVPKLALLFKAENGERILGGLSPPPWMLLQAQEKGSYRTEDCIEFLKWALPDASCAEESIVVLLDWFSAHLHDDVHDILRQKGHILLHHGGGVTGFEQVNAARLELPPLLFESYVRTCRLTLII